MNINFTKIAQKLPKNNDLILYVHITTLQDNVDVNMNAGRVKLKWYEYTPYHISSGTYPGSCISYEEGMVPPENRGDCYYKLVAIVNNFVLPDDAEWATLSDFTSAISQKSVRFDYKLASDHKPNEGQSIIAIVNIDGQLVHKQGIVYYCWHLFQNGVMANSHLPVGGADPNCMLTESDSEYRLVAHIKGYVMYHNTPWIDEQEFEKAMK